MKQLYAGHYSKYPQIMPPATLCINGMSEQRNALKKNHFQLLSHFIQSKCNIHSSHVTRGNALKDLGIFIRDPWPSPAPIFITFKTIIRVLFLLCLVTWWVCWYGGLQVWPFTFPPSLPTWARSRPVRAQILPGVPYLLPSASDRLGSPFSFRSCRCPPTVFQQLPNDG